MLKLISTIIQPVTTPGLHFHHVPHLATIKGPIVSMDAGTPRPQKRAEAGGVDHTGNEGPGMSANGTPSAPEGTITRSVVRAPATAQEGEAFPLITGSPNGRRLSSSVDGLRIGDTYTRRPVKLFSHGDLKHVCPGRCIVL